MSTTHKVRRITHGRRLPGRRAWTEFAAGGEPLGNDLAFKGYAVDPPSVLQPITEAYTNLDERQRAVRLAAIQLLALVGKEVPSP